MGTMDNSPNVKATEEQKAILGNIGNQDFDFGEQYKETGTPTGMASYFVIFN